MLDSVPDPVFWPAYVALWVVFSALVGFLFGAIARFGRGEDDK